MTFSAQNDGYPLILYYTALNLCAIQKVEELQDEISRLRKALALMTETELARRAQEAQNEVSTATQRVDMLLVS